MMQVVKFPIRLRLYKRGEMIYFSQLDVMHILERSLRRAQLPLYFTQGFNPRVKISFSKALKLGEEGQIEVTFYFAEEITRDELIEKLIPQLPSGLEIIRSD